MTSKNYAEDFFDPGLPDLDIKYFKNFLSEKEASSLFHKLLSGMNWQQHYIKIFGKNLPQPRLTALYGETEISYTYSGLTLYPLPYTPELEALQKKLELLTTIRFTHCLANLYRDGNDSMGWHSDDEKELGIDPVIASVSLGAERKFQFKHKIQKELKYGLSLQHGNLLLMMGKTQQNWKHQLPKTKKVDSARINLTFRVIK